MNQIVSYLLLIVFSVHTIDCLRLFRQKRMPDSSADDLLLAPHMTGDFGSGNSDTQMIICKNRFDCEDACRRTSAGQLSSKADLPILTDSHKVGIQLGRRNDCDKCQLIYANCDQKFMSMAAKFWADSRQIAPKSKNDIWALRVRTSYPTTGSSKYLILNPFKSNHSLKTCLI